MADIVIIDDTEDTSIPIDITDVDKEYGTEEGEIDDGNKSDKSDIQCLNGSDDSIQRINKKEHSFKNEARESTKMLASFEIKFRSVTEYDKLGEAILKALKSSETVGEAKYEYVKSGTTILAFGVETCEDEEKSNDSTDFGDDLNKLFTIDAAPSVKLQVSEVPSYKRHSTDVLDNEVKRKMVKAEDDCPRPKPTNSCFNCGSYDHGLRDCLMPRNAQRIAKAKKAKSKGERYHVDVDQRFSHLKPGEISEKLRKALSLRKNELPSFFYRMRSLGYPPGWLEDAKVSHSGLAMFNTNDDVLKCEEDRSECEIKYDISKIIDFPGFNSMPDGYIDNYKYYNVPSYSEKYSKETMIAALGDTAIKGFKRKKLKDHNEGATTQNLQVELAEANSCDDGMEIVDDAEEIQVELTTPMPPADSPPEHESSLPPLPLPVTTDSMPHLPSIENSNDTTPTIATSNDAEVSRSSASANEERTLSPTLEELRAQQRYLLSKLSNGEDESLNEAVYGAPLAELTKPKEATETPTTPITPSTSLPQRTSTDLQHIIKTSHIGTPVLKFSPFDKIPATDNFKIGVSDVINFENLPDSTGKYETMKEVLHKVRQAKKRLAEDD